MGDSRQCARAQPFGQHFPAVDQAGPLCGEQQALKRWQHTAKLAQRREFGRREGKLVSRQARGAVQEEELLCLA